MRDDIFVAGVGRQLRFDICSSVMDSRVQHCTEVSAISEVCRCSSLTVAKIDTFSVFFASCHVVSYLFL